MILGHLYGKATTNNFKFLVKETARKFEFVQVHHPEYGFVLCQITKLERDPDKTIAFCSVIGRKSKRTGRITPMRTPFEPDSDVLIAQDDFIKEMIELKDPDGAYLGKLEGKEIPVHVNLNHVLTKHMAVLAKSGAGKSYAVGALVEEIMEKKVPLLIIDPHGEYSQLKYPNDEDKDKLATFHTEPKGYLRHIQEFGLDSDLKPIRLKSDLTPEELVHLLPAKLSNTQKNLLYGVLQDLDEVSLERVLISLNMSDSGSKYSIISIIEYLKNLNIFSDKFTQYRELIQPGKCSIINLRGVDPAVSEIIVYKLMKDLFEERKKGRISPFFTVIEEAHNFCPERGFGEAKSSKILRTIASEGRKFGMGICIISQRPARVDKSVLSQISTQLILKVTNPNDLKAISNSVEGITSDSESEIPNLPIGTGMITGVFDIPLLVSIRPRRTLHGGDAVDILGAAESASVVDEASKFGEKEVLPIVRSFVKEADLKLMTDKEIKEIRRILIPATMFTCTAENESYDLLIERLSGTVIMDIDKRQALPLPNVGVLSPNETQAFRCAVNNQNVSIGSLMEKTDLSLTDAKTSLSTLQQKNLLNYDRGIFFVPPNLKMDLKSHKTPYKTEFLALTYDQMIEPKHTEDQIANNVSAFAEVTESNDCYILYHDIVFK